MNKKQILLFLTFILCLLSGGIYLSKYSNKRNLEKSNSLRTRNEVENSEEVEKEIEKKALSNRNDSFVVNAEEIFQRIEKIEKAWQDKMKETFIEDMGLSIDEYNEYRVMKKGYEDDRHDAYEKFHKEKAQLGEDYPITSENSENDKIVEEYQELFKLRFGEEGFAHYMKSLDEFNSDLRSESAQDEEILSIDF